MLSMRVLGLALGVAVTLAALGACGSDDGGEVTPESPDGDVSGEGGPLGDGFVPPMRAEFGLDSRPSNPTCKAPARPPSTAPVKLVQVFANVGLNAPMMMQQIPGDKTRWFVAQRDGTIVSFPTTSPPNTTTPVTNVSTLSGKTINLAGEGGLLGFVFHPKFAQNGKAYISWTTTGGTSGMQSIIGEIHSPNNGTSFDTYKEILGPFPQPATNHNGGGLTFGKDGFLYASFGDGGNRDDAFHNGQNKDGFFSKILRIDVDNPSGGMPYGIPTGNPYKNGGGEPATFAMGFRNPFRFSVDRATNEVWVGDVGQDNYEEVDAKVKIGGNYGWPCREGLHDSPNSADPAKCPLGPTTPGLVDPVFEHQHVPTNSRSITGGVVYRGKDVPGFVGSYIYADYIKAQIWTLSFDPGTGAAVSTQLDASAAPSEDWVYFAEDNDNEVYAVALSSGQVWKVTQAALPEPSAKPFPDRLSKTGCTDPSDAKKPASGLVPYGVNAPLWSDGAQKDRWVALPDGKTITVKAADGDFDFPNGTVLVKTFTVGGKRIETRLFMRHDDGGWNGYTYEWLDDQSDAVLLPAGKTKTVGTQTWTYPSRSDCVNCHSDAAGRSLGLELGQLNGDYVYPATNRISNQLTTLEHIGMFGAPLGKPAAQLIAYPDPYGAAPVEARARAYLHSNCSNCHRPKGPGLGDMDLRFGNSFADTKTCNVEPLQGDIGVAGAKLLVPLAPEKSLVSLRPHSPAANRMPPLASSVVDSPGVKVIDDWIKSVKACP